MRFNLVEEFFGKRKYVGKSVEIDLISLFKSYREPAPLTWLGGTFISPFLNHNLKWFTGYTSYWGIPGFIFLHRFKSKNKLVNI
jgi:hypothetical protein